MSAAGRGAASDPGRRCARWRARIQRWRPAVSPAAAAALVRGGRRRGRGAAAGAGAAPAAPPPARGAAPPSCAITGHRADCSRPRSRWPTDAREQGSCSRSRSYRPSCSRTAVSRLLSKDGDCVSRKSDHAESRLDALRRQPHRQSLQSARADQPDATCSGSAPHGCFRSRAIRARFSRRRSCRTASCTSRAGTRSTRSTRRPGASSGRTASRVTKAFSAKAASAPIAASTISGDKAFMVTDHAHLLGFNRFTGQKLWDAEMGSHEESYSSTSPPLPVGDLLVVGVAGGEEGARGFLDAYRASTGERVWRWYSIPKRGEKGSETWIGQALEHGCGATWMPGSYDPQLDLIYWAIGNPCPGHRRRRTHRRQPLHVERRRARREDRRDEVVLPVHAARHARLGRRAADAARRRECGRGSRASC